MLRIDTPVQLQDPRITDRREFLTGRVVQTTAKGFVGDFIVSGLEISTDDDLVVYYETKRKFVQQAARAVSVSEAEKGLRIEVMPVGEPVAAEGREVYRVPSSGTGIKATLDGETDCPLLDVSSLGFAVNATAEYPIGKTLQVSIEWNGETYTGTASIQSVRSVSRGRTRYGLRFLDDAGAGNLKQGLMKISMAVERQHLKNLSGK